MVDQGLGARDETDGMGKFGMCIERSLVYPARVDVAKTWVLDRSKGSKCNATRFSACRHAHLLDCVLKLVPQAFLGVEPRNNEQFDPPLLSPWLRINPNPSGERARGQKTTSQRTMRCHVF
jgi:hypothetical protein